MLFFSNFRRPQWVTMAFMNIFHIVKNEKKNEVILHKYPLSDDATEANHGVVFTLFKRARKLT